MRLWLPDTGLHGFMSVTVAEVENLPPAEGYERYVVLEVRQTERGGGRKRGKGGG